MKTCFVDKTDGLIIFQLRKHSQVATCCFLLINARDQNQICAWGMSMVSFYVHYFHGGKTSKMFVLVVYYALRYHRVGLSWN